MTPLTGRANRGCSRAGQGSSLERQIETGGSEGERPPRTCHGGWTIYCDMMRRRVVVMVWAALLVGQSSCSRQSRAYKEFLPPVVRPQQEQVTTRF